MNCRAHIYTSSLIGGVLYAVTQSSQAAISSLLSGILLDIDHIFDFLIFSDDKISIKNLFSWCDGGRWEKITLIFHSYELYVLLVVVTYYFHHDILIGAMFGTGFHLLLDVIGNCYLRKNFRFSPIFYFLTYRIFAGFNKNRLRTDYDLAKPEPSR